MNNNLTKTLLFISFLMSSLVAFAQPIQLTLIKRPPHLARIDDINDFSAQMFVSAVNTSNQTVTFNLNFTASGPNGLTIEATQFLQENIVLEAGESLTLDGNGFEDYGTQGLTEEDIQPADERNYLKINRVLREGRYTYCIVAVSPNDPTLFLSDPNEGCDYFDLAYGEPPIITFPENNEHIQALDPAILNVSWSHNAMGAPGLFEYTLKIIDITTFQDVDPIEIIEQPGVPVLYEDVYEGQLFTGLNDLDFEEGHRYALRVTVIDPEDHVRFEQAGKSNVVVIFYGNQAGDVPVQTDECACANTSALPKITLTRPSPETSPRLAKINKITEHGQALLTCMPQADSTTHNITYAIDWGISSVSNFLQTPDSTHNYTDLEQIPSSICVEFMISRKDGTGTPCTQEECITVEPDLFDIPTPTDVDIANIPKGTISQGDTLHAGENGEFDIILTQLSGNKSGYNGEGTAFISWLQARVKVAFKKITVDNVKRLRSGNVVAQIANNPPTYPKDWPLEALASNAWTNEVAGSIVEWVENANDQKLPYKSPNEWTNPLMMPLGLVFNSDNELVLTEMVFQRNKSQFNIIGAMSTPLDWGEPQTIGFRAAGIAFHPADISSSPKRLELVANLLVADDNLNTTYQFIAPTDVRPGCYIEWGTTGFSHFGLEMESELSRNWLVPAANDNGIDKVKISLAAESSSWDDLVFTGNLQKSIIVGTGGIEIEAQAISYDMSDVINPQQIHFPANYQGTKNNQFRGFFAKAISLHLPEVWENASEPIDIQVSNLIIDKMGITLKAVADNVADFSTTSVIHMAASIKHVDIQMVSSSLTHAIIKGKIGLPLTDVATITDNSKINYSATLHVKSNNPSDTTKTSLQIVVQPTENQDIDFDLISSKIKLSNTSNIIAYADKDHMKFTLNLTGKVNMKGDISVGPLSLNSIGMKVEKMKLSYDSQGDKLEFNKGNSMVWAHSSPQKYLSSGTDEGFPFSISNIGYTKLTNEGNQYLHGKLTMKVQLNLTEDLGGFTTLGIENAILKSNSAAKFKPTYITTTIDSIKVSADLGSVKIDGAVAMRNNDPIYGNGFAGELNARFKVPKALVQARAEFGKVNNYRYWRVQAGAAFSPAIPLGAGISFYGFGGGAYYNMNATANTDANVALIDRFKFKPKKNIAGFQVAASLGAPKAETFNSEMQISGQVNLQTKGLEKVAFDGKFWMGTAINKRPKAPIKGTASVNYDFTQEIFNLNATVNVNKKPITAQNVGFNVHIDGPNNKWYIKFGEPAVPNRITVGFDGFSLDVDSYFMVGNDIPRPSIFSQRFLDGFHGATGKYPSFVPSQKSTSANSNTAHGAGIALGTGFNFKAEAYVPLAFDYYAGVQGTAGSELNLSLLEYSSLKAPGAKYKGLNGWLAGGSIGFYASVGAGIYSKNGSNYESEFTLANFGGGGYVVGQFPDPVWLAGEVAGKAKVGCFLGHCLYRGSVAIDFEYGTQFDPGEPNIAVIEAKEDTRDVLLKDNLIETINTHIVKYVHPESYDAFPLDAPIAIKFITQPNHPFEIEGKNNLRTFKFTTTVVLQARNATNCDWTTLPLSATLMGDAEVLYSLEPVEYEEHEFNGSIGFFGSGGAESNSDFFVTKPINHLTVNTNYKLIIDVILEEYKNGAWHTVIFEDKPYGEVNVVNFKTIEGPKSQEELQCDAMYHKMTVKEYLMHTEEKRAQLRAENGGTYYISNSGDCECPRLTADEKAGAESAHSYTTMMEMENGLLWEAMTHGEFTDQFNPENNWGGGFGPDGGTVDPSIGGGDGYYNPIDNGILNPNGFSENGINYENVNTIDYGSFEAFGNNPVITH